MHSSLILKCFFYNLTALIMLIFYVDDDSDDRELFSYAIKSVDPRIVLVAFESGEDLLTFIRSGTPLPDFIFMDINMPKMNGYECVQEIRSREIFNTVKIIMYSTSFNPDEQSRFNQPGVDFLIKPSELENLVQYIEMLIVKNNFTPLEETR